MVILSEEQHDDYLAHYGILRKSGRYPWGSGKDQNTRNKMFLDSVEELRKAGMKDTDIVKGLGLQSTTQLRALSSIAKNQQRASTIAQAQKLRDKGYSNSAIARRMNLAGESSVRALLDSNAKDRADILNSTADMLRREVDDKQFIDVGKGVETHLGISKERLNTAVEMLREQGYVTHPVTTIQIGTGLDTRIKVLAKPGTTWSEVQKNRGNIQNIQSVTDNGGRNFSSEKVHPFVSVDPKRVQVRYKEQGGAKADGVIYVRPNVDDVSLGQARYAQVRVKVGDSHYLKGMAMYKDDLPDGVDLVFNTNKSDTGNKLDSMKSLENSELYPFKTVVRQQVVNKGLENEHVKSAMNIVYEEGKWGDWSKTLSSQFLSKQSPTLAKEQLSKTFDRRQKEFDSINALTNPTVKKKLLEDFANTTDRASVHLSAAALNSRQKWQVILPIESMPHNQVYAPNFHDGERVVLIRHPHAGTFEIPELVVNNKQPEARRLLKDAQDAIGIHHSVAERLSGADFDGDTVIVIPNNQSKVRHTHALEQLKGFDPKSAYPKYEGMEVITPQRKQAEMGKISNLITDMTIKQASHEEIARAVKHSMVVIDAEKHELDYKRSFSENGIAQLKATYQGGARKGASTLISLAESRIDVVDRKGRPQSEGEGGPIDRLTGEKRFVPTGKQRLNSKGELVDKTIRSKKLAETNDAHTLSSHTPMEKIYGDHSNKLKALANKARLESLHVPSLVYSPSAAKAFSKEVTELDAALSLAKQNAPLERQAQLLTRVVMRAHKDAYPELDKEGLEKVQFQELTKARNRVGAGKQQIKITPSQWLAIQAGAISNSKLIQILNNADTDVVKQLATPRAKHTMNAAMTSRAKAMLASGRYTRADVARQLGVSLSTLQDSIKGES